MDEPLQSREQGLGLRLCAICFQWRPIDEMERHTAGAEGTAENRRRTTVWFTCRDGCRRIDETRK